MEFSDIQRKNIETVVTVANLLLERRKKGIRDVVPRLEKLRKAEFHIEAVLVNGQLIEHSLKGILHSCRLEREITKILELPDPYPYGVMKDEDELKRFKKDFDDFNRRELGKVINIFRQATGEVELASRLEQFNSFRVELAHHVFSGEYDLDAVNKQADDYLNNPAMPQLILDILTAYNKVKKRSEDLYLHK